MMMWLWCPHTVALHHTVPWFYKWPYVCKEQQNHLYPVLNWTRSNFIICQYWVSTVWESLCFKMAISKAVVSRVRVLAITHILVGALLIIFGIANGVTQNFYDTFNSSFGFFGIGTGVWVSLHCRNSAFVRYNLTYFSPLQPFSALAFLPACSSRWKLTWKQV